MKELLKKLFPEVITRFVKEMHLVLRKYYFTGNKYHCPICNNHFRKFLPGGFDLDVITEKNIIGAGRRDNMLCPYCQSTDRDRLIFLFLRNKIDIFNQKLKILHIAPEPSLYKFLKKIKNILYVTGTKYSEGIYFHKNINSVDLLQLPYKDNEFDMVICNHVLEHILDDNKAMSEIYRVLTINGIAILQVPISYQLDSTLEDFSITDPKLREKHFGQFDHVRIYGNDYASKLEKVGFEVQTYDPFTDEENNSNLIPFALNKNEKLFVGYKKK